MKRWIAPLGSVFAVAGVIALALFLAGVFDGDEASGSRGDGSESAALCAEDQPDCDDTLIGSDGDDDEEIGVAPGCEAGHVGVCDDTPIADGEVGDLFEGDGPVSQPVCAPGFPDCVDTIVVPIGTLDDDRDSGSQGSDDSFGQDGAVGPGSSATSDRAPAE